MRNIRYEVNTKAYEQLRNPALDRVLDPVWDRIEARVLDPVWGRVRTQVGSPVQSQIWNEVTDHA